MVRMGPTCPSCRANGVQTPRGDNPAGRCDACQTAVDTAAAIKAAERERAAAEAKALREARAAACTDCLAEGREPKACRPVDPKMPGRRCFTHGKAARKASKLVAHARRVELGYGITGEQYWALYKAQGGRCALCQRATGKTKRLAVDHDHAKAREVCGHDPKIGCPNCVRGLLCGPCNTGLVIHPVDTLLRAVSYRYDPPARAVLARFANLDVPTGGDDESPV